MTDIDIIDIWVDTYSEFNVVFVETIVFNANGSGTFSEIEDSVLIETIPYKLDSF